MKKAIMVIIAFASMAAHAQLKVSDVEPTELIGEFKQLGTVKAMIERSGEMAIFSYKDINYQHIDEYKSFSLPYSDIDELYGLFSDLSDREKGETKIVELENGESLRFKYGRTFGKMYAEVLHMSPAGNVGAVQWMTGKQLDRLFGKR